MLEGFRRSTFVRELTAKPSNYKQANHTMHSGAQPSVQIHTNKQMFNSFVHCKTSWSGGSHCQISRPTAFPITFLLSSIPLKIKGITWEMYVWDSNPGKFMSGTGTMHRTCIYAMVRLKNSQMTDMGSVHNSLLAGGSQEVNNCFNFVVLISTMQVSLSVLHVLNKQYS